MMLRTDGPPRQHDLQWRAGGKKGLPRHEAIPLELVAPGRRGACRSHRDSRRGICQTQARQPS